MVELTLLLLDLGDYALRSGSGQVNHRASVLSWHSEGASCACYWNLRLRKVAGSRSNHFFVKVESSMRWGLR
jgi:hypothetical protein